MLINRIEICNLQSWKGGEVLNLSPCGLTVLKGPSETGKSVLPRFIMRFCTNDMDSDSLFKAYVRKGCEQGGLIFYDDKSEEKLSMIIAPGGRFLIHETYNDDIISVKIEEEINEQVLETFGFIVDNVNNMVVNLFSRDNPFLGVSTSPLLNGAVLDRVLTGRDIERVIAYLKHQEETMRKFIKEQTIKREVYRSRLENTAHIDEAVLSMAQIRAEIVESFSFRMATVENALMDLQQSRKNFIEIPPPKSLSELQSAKLLIEHMSAIKQELNRIQQVDIDVTKLNEYRNRMDIAHQFCGKMMALKVNLREINTTLPQAPTKYSQEELNNLLMLVNRLGELYVLSNEIKTNKKQLKKVECGLLEAETVLNALKEELQVCPLCGSGFGG